MGYPAAEDVSGDRFWDAELGFGITKPDQWVFVAREFEREARDMMSLGNPALDEGFRNSPSLPLVIIAKNVDSTAYVNPSVKVGVRPLDGLAGLAPRDVAVVVLNQMRRAVPSLEALGPACAAVVAGRAAGRLEAKFLVEWNDGTTSPVLTRMWLVPRGDQLFIIAMTSPSPTDQGTESEFLQMLNSIQIASARSSGGGR